MHCLFLHCFKVHSVSQENSFQYLLEADGHQRWGGIFESKINDAFHVCNTDKKKPKLLKKFDNWNESESNLARRLPYFLDNPSSYFTTEETVNSYCLENV